MEHEGATGGEPQRTTVKQEWDKKLAEAKELDSDLLANIRQLTIRVLDNLDEGSRNRTLDEQQKRLLSSTGARLLRLWRLVEKEGRTKKMLEETRRTNGTASEPWTAEQRDEKA